MQIEDFKDIALMVFFSSGFAILVLFFYWNILYLLLTRRYDKLLFKEPFFNKNEITVYSVWPFSLVKATAYILLITNSSIAKKRFKSLDEPINESKIIMFFCYFLIYATLFFGGIFFIGMLWGAVDMLGS